MSETFDRDFQSNAQTIVESPSIKVDTLTASAVMNESFNRKRKLLTPVVQNPHLLVPKSSNDTPSAARDAKLSRKQDRVLTSAMSDSVTPESLMTQCAIVHSDVAPTPHVPVTAMPPTPMCGGTAFDSTPNGFDQSPTEVEFAEPEDPPAGQVTENTTNCEMEDRKDTTNFPSSATSTTTTTTPSPIGRAAPLNLRNFSNWMVPDRYRLVRLLGKGSYGQVAEAYDSHLQKKVAIKKIANVFDQEIDTKRLYREIYILRHLNHSQVIKLLNVLAPENEESYNELYLVFEFVDTDLHKLIMSPQYLTIRHIQVFLYQLLCGLYYVHSANVIHRDLKPANILLNEDCTLMICDFGLSRIMDNDLGSDTKQNQFIVDTKSPVTDYSSSTTSPASSSGSTPDGSRVFRRQLTKHVVTRWYRAPELILLQDYSFEVDMWSIGCIFAELLSMQVESYPRYRERVPLFPGRSCFPLSADRPTTFSDKLDQLNVIFNVIGTPSESDIGDLGEVKQYLRKLPKKQARNLQEIYPGAPADSLDLLKQMLLFNPKMRITVADALNHPFLDSVRRAQDTTKANIFCMDVENIPMTKEEVKARINEEIRHYDQLNAAVAPSN
uniref:Mitogen-activated protein kinase n=1 Tax=Albugo laibachii Nc14 TaxID=890382 RepID=F0W9R8_9STRA|nr:mitogenactivated protein kinase putative [Albugo laibachii Nc14]|eukprot:CCA17886.1 mitogenactivated protein kinase putative [Albugo laibachii Nc14]